MRRTDPAYLHVASVSCTRYLGVKVKPITVDVGKGTVELEAGGILHLVWKPGTTLDASDVDAAIATINEVADGVEYPDAD